MKKEYGDYYLGLDIGTGSVGWAVTDLNYNVLKFNGKAMWGARLFDTANTAADTRVHRTARRRLAREKQRIKYLQEFFAVEIAKVDPGFYVRMQESNLQHDERVNSQRADKKYHSIFNDGLYTDAKYYEDFPTVYHLRKALLNGQELDVRLVYLAIKHILNHRGHFLLDGDIDAVGNFDSALSDLNNYLAENFEEYISIPEEISVAIQDVLKNRKLSRSAKKEQLIKVINVDKKNKQLVAVISAVCGLTFKLTDLFADETLVDEDNGKDLTSDISKLDEEKYAELESKLDDRIELINRLKVIYDWSLLSEILSGEKYLSVAKVNTYNAHQKDLKILKNLLVRKNLHDVKKKIFSYSTGCKDPNYSSYIGMCNKNGKKVPIDKVCNSEDFCKFLNKQFENIEDLTEEEKALVDRIKNGTAFPKQVVKDNGVIPMQVHKAELAIILENASKYLPFLNEKDINGQTVAEKIMQVFAFRVPYYVGPLNGTAYSKEKGRCWVVRSDEKVTPWNFNNVVDVEKSAEEFIKKMTSKCTYLVGEDVLPKNSLLYTEFVARNEINNIRVDGTRLDAKYINLIYDELLLNGGVKGKVTIKKIQNFLATHNIRGEVSGVDQSLNCSLKVFQDFANIFGGLQYVNSHRDMIEDLIKWITLFGDEPSMLKVKIKKEYPEIDAAKVNRIAKLKYKDWGRLSKKLLESDEISYVDESIGEKITVISALRNTNLNFMELVEGKTEYDFKEKIRCFNEGLEQNENVFDYACVEKLYVSPAIKREIWQTLLIVKELKKILGHAPKKIFVEMARGEEEKKRTVSRKQRLLDLYKTCKNEEPELFASLNACTEEDLRRNVLYLYYTQLGKDMYTGKPINVEELSTSYDKDHIYPRSKTKDDSIINNLVLVNRTDNARKTDVYPLPSEVRKNMLSFWQMLKNKRLISDEKFNRLVRTTPLSDDELADFVNRQLVETRQSTKAVAELFQKAFPETRIVYSKAGHVSDFRQEFDIVKCREINDLHHAKDAYLNIVVGNVYDTQFTGNALRFIKSGQKYTLNPNVLFKKWDIKGAWVKGETGTIATVLKYMARNNILITWMQQEGHGELYKLNPLKKGKGQVPVRSNLPIDKYGGYNRASTAYFSLVESTVKNKKVLSLETLPLLVVMDMKKNENSLIKYLKDNLGLEEPRIKIERILINTVVNINGCKLLLTGKTGKSLCASVADQLILDQGNVMYMKKVQNYLARFKKYPTARITKFDEIDRDTNLSLYEILLEKHRCSNYINRPAGQIKLLASESAKAKFKELSLEEQCKVLNQIMNLFKTSVQSADLTQIGGTGRAGTIAFNKDITSCKIATLYNISVTGLFVQEIDLLKL